MFHAFLQSPCSAPPQRFNYPFSYQPHPLVEQAAAEMCAYIETQSAWCEELAAGKMLGVLVVSRADGTLGYLAAYSGLLMGQNALPYFVPAVYDFLQPDSYFVENEAVLNRLNASIVETEQSVEYRHAREALATAETAAAAELAAMRQQLQSAKAERDCRRSTSALTPDEEAALVRQSQRMKADFQRLKKQHQQLIAQAQAELSIHTARIDALKTQRRQLSDHLQTWIFCQFRMLNVLGETADLIDIFKSATPPIPPAGAGECALPKLLQYAFLHHLRPLCFGEFWWGKSPSHEVRHHRHFYPSCTGKCKPILAHMLRGLEVDDNPLAAAPGSEQLLPIIYEDEQLVVVNKPSGMLSVPGTSEQSSAQSLLAAMRTEIYTVHRLDMDTSGILVFAKTKAAQARLQQQFAERQTKKSYVALVEGVPCDVQGYVRLPLSPDLLDRPRQVVDFSNGKPAVTQYKVVRTEQLDGRTVSRLQLHPHTGRTHQLRLHCAHAEGLACPIVGDALYGNARQRLCLHAERLTFKHPATGGFLRLQAECPF